MSEVSPAVNRSSFRRFLTAAVISSAGSSVTAVAMHTWGAHLVLHVSHRSADAHNGLTSTTSSAVVSTAGPTPPSNAESCVHGAILSVPFALPDLPVDVQTHTVTVDAQSHLVYCGHI